VLLIVVFEFSLGAAIGYSRERMLSDDDMIEGGRKALCLALMLFVPALVAQTRGFGQHYTD
jgi:hypothetical protein